MKTYTKIILIVAASLFTAACAELDTFPEGATVTEDQKKDIAEKAPERMVADLNGMYAILGKINGIYARDNEFGYPSVAITMECNGADFFGPNDGYNWFSTESAFEDRDYTYADPHARWRLFYNQIRAANALLGTITADVEKRELKHYRGQALAVRAFAYFNLAQLYQFTCKGNETAPVVPLIEETTETAANPRASVAEVYALITRDLDEAIILLEGLTRTNKAFVNQQVAYGIRARVNLVKEEWADAASDAEKAMQGVKFLSLSDVSRPSFNSADASSWMWAILMNPAIISNNLATWQSKLSSFTGYGYTTAVGMYKCINVLLWNKIPATDVRKGWWVDDQLNSPLLNGFSWPGYPGQPIGPLQIADIKMPFLPYTNVKFGPYNNEPGNTENAGDWCLMRAEEMLLIRAEGLAKSGDPGGAKNLLESFIQTYRDPNYTCTASSADALQNEVWLQRRIELWGEGFSFYDRHRLNRNMVRVATGVASNFPEEWQFNMRANDGWLLNRIPSSEINANDGISEDQNNKDGQIPKAGDGAGLTDGVVVP
jgi:hypothetical protein